MKPKFWVEPWEDGGFVAVCDTGYGEEERFAGPFETESEAKAFNDETENMLKNLKGRLN